MKRNLMIVVVSAILLTMALPVMADGIILPPVPPPGPFTDPVWLTIKYHHVDITIDNQVAITRIDQVFVNEGNSVAEGTYIFPVPQGATVSEFTMWVDGQAIQPQLLEADEARQIYNDIVAQLRDPALLEYVGTNAIRANVFPIPPGEERRIEIEYQEVLEVENGLVRYTYPLNTERFSARPLDSVAVNVTVVSNDPVQAVYSPSHPVAVDQTNPNNVRVGYEENSITPDTDFTLYYSIAPDDIDVNLLTYRESADEEGFFMLLIAPPLVVDEGAAIPKDVIVVLDQSGSMVGEKWDQAREAVGYVLDSLNAEDRFNAVVFSTGHRVYANELQGPSEAENATRWINGLEAIGGTDIDGALERAFDMADPDRSTVVLFMTDGVPTEGETNISEIIDNAEANAPDNVRLFSFGVGDDVDAFLLDQLSQDNRGTSSYVRPGERIDEAVAAWYAKVDAPVLTNVELTFDGVMIDDQFPAAPLPDLFAGTQLVIVGRYRGSANDASVTLAGEVDGDAAEYVYEGLRFHSNAGGGSDSDAEVFIPRLWATRKIGAMLDDIRLNGENSELVDSVIRLSLRYGIMTPYTSFLIQEDDIFTQTGRNIIMEEAESSMDLAFSQTSGAAAVDAAEAIGDARSANAPMAMPTGTVVGKDGNEVQVQDVLRHVRDKTFAWRDGVWIDTTYDADNMVPVEVVFLSDDYFALVGDNPILGDYFALGEQVIVVIDGMVYRVIVE